jgi:polysaccharide deacetylase family protein (PEP-CTERM system associated)
VKAAVLSIDVEDWYHLDYFDRSRCDRSYSLLDGLEVFREVLSLQGIPATFFVLGELAQALRTPLGELVAEGHDIGSHGWDHIRPLTLQMDAFRQDLTRSKAELEHILGNPVLGYRAPCFSLDRARLDLIEQCGFAYDSSRIQFRAHRLYGSWDTTGFSRVSGNIFRRGAFFEFEVSTLAVGRKSFPVSGGGYLRIFPWLLMRWLIRRYLTTNELYVLYIHPFELSRRADPPVPSGTKKLSELRFKTGRSSVVKKLSQLISLLRKNGFHFTTFAQLRQGLMATPPAVPSP